MIRRFHYSVVIATLLILVVASYLAFDSESDYEPSLPVMTIDTEDGAAVESKEVFTDCTITVSNTESEYALDDESGEIRGRGNTSWNQPSWWTMPKKSYRISFDDPVDLFGNGSATDWTLIANYIDQSLSRNLFAYAIADEIDAPYTTSTQCVVLYLNGIYQGVYLVCEQVEIGPDRVGEIEKDYSSVEGSGYMVEQFISNWDDPVEGVDYFTVDGMKFHPSGLRNDTWTEENFDYISGYVDSCWSAICSGNWSRVTGLIDADSFARTYIVQELFHNRDVAGASIFMYKQPYGKLVSGPVWDFDNSSGNGTGLKEKDPDQLWAADMNLWYSKLLGYDEFRGIVGSILEERHDGIVDRIDSEFAYVMRYSDDFKQNFAKWPITGALVGSNPLEFLAMDTWHEHVEYLCDWLKASLDHLMDVYCS